jgi:hypothetical protein
MGIKLANSMTVRVVSERGTTKPTPLLEKCSQNDMGTDGPSDGQSLL